MYNPKHFEKARVIARLSVYGELEHQVLDNLKVVSDAVPMTIGSNHTLAKLADTKLADTMPT